ncbi:MAG: hypothetical protein MI892_23630 [Desulfobacterales bacterium]|nr:hypothetical protein [Desulfobacterales bacterium]
MNQTFASIELARLYETQGHLQDALSMYKELLEDGTEDLPEIQAAIKRLEKSENKPFTATDSKASKAEEIAATLALLNEDAPGSDVQTNESADASEKGIDDLEQVLDILEPEQEPAEPVMRSDAEDKMAQLMEKWLMLMVVQKRVNMFKAIKARL